jgi:hypothetical protein
MPTVTSKRQAPKGPTKVKQSTINAIKKTGMTKALGSITPAQRKNAAYMTGLKRMYGVARVNKALGITGGSPVKFGGGSGRRTQSSPVKFGGGQGMRNTAKKTTTRGSVGAVQQALAARAPKLRTSKPTTSNTRYAQSNPKAQAAYKAKQAQRAARVAKDPKKKDFPSRSRAY